MVKRLAVPRPRPTRKAEMAAAVERHLGNAPFRQCWDGLDGIKQTAVREVLCGHEHGIDWNQLVARHGALSPRLAQVRHSVPVPLCFLYRYGRPYESHTFVVPAEIAQRLLEFVPPPPEVVLA